MQNTIVPQPLDLTIVIPTKNEAKHLHACFDSIGSDFAAAIMVVDSESTDATRAITLERGATVIDFKWNGQFPKKRNWFLQNHKPATRWVLFLDADENLTPAVKKEIRIVLRQTSHVGFWLRYSIQFMGATLKGGYPLRKLALFQVGTGEYERIDEDRWSNLDMEIHEHPILHGTTGEIRSPIKHCDFRDIHHYIAKHNEYSSWEAARLVSINGRSASRHPWTVKQRLKYSLLRTPLIGPVYFLGSYILMGGFMDGYRGLAFAILKSAYFTQIYCKISEIEGLKKKEC